MYEKTKLALYYHAFCLNVSPTTFCIVIAWLCFSVSVYGVSLLVVLCTCMKN